MHLESTAPSESFETSVRSTHISNIHNSAPARKSLHSKEVYRVEARVIIQRDVCCARSENRNKHPMSEHKSGAKIGRICVRSCRLRRFRHHHSIKRNKKEMRTKSTRTSCLVRYPPWHPE